VTVLHLHVASARPRNERSVLLCEGSVCAPGQYVPHSTKQALTNFAELRLREVRSSLGPKDEDFSGSSAVTSRDCLLHNDATKAT